MITGQELVERGYKLLPINRTDKMPSIAFSGVDVTDSALIAERIGGRVAIRMTGLLTVDIDRSESHEEADNRRSDRFLDNMIKSGLFDPEKDMWQKTASGGTHIVYCLPEGAVLKPLVIKARKWTPEVDIKTGPNAYILNYGGFNTLKPRNVPKKLLSMLWKAGLIEDSEKMKEAYKQRQSSLTQAEISESLESVNFYIRGSVKGDRNNRLRDATYKALYYDGIPVDVAEPVIREAAMSVGLDEREIRITIEHTLEKLGD